LGTYATATELRRIEIGNYSVGDVDGSIIEEDKVLEELQNAKR
jgi:predicted aspartyl protease